MLGVMHTPRGPSPFKRERKGKMEGRREGGAKGGKREKREKRERGGRKGGERDEEIETRQREKAF